MDPKNVAYVLDHFKWKIPKLKYQEFISHQIYNAYLHI